MGPVNGTVSPLSSNRSWSCEGAAGFLSVDVAVIIIEMAVNAFALVQVFFIEVEELKGANCLCVGTGKVEVDATGWLEYDMVISVLD